MALWSSCKSDSVMVQMTDYSNPGSGELVKRISLSVNPAVNGY